jgi:hypothetical protein
MLNNFDNYLNEASLRGNIGVPGEGGSSDPSWLAKVKMEKDPRMAEFERENRADIQNFMSLIGQSQRLQAGHEDALSDLTVTAFRTLFKGLLDDVEFDFKLNSEAREMLEETPDKPELPDFEEITDEKIVNEIHKRKILRTIQQGMGLNSKAILNLPLFKSGIKDILGAEDGERYLSLLNKISDVAKFNDWRLPDNVIQQFLRMSGAGASSIDFPEEEVDPDLAQKVLDDLEKGKDFTESDSAEEMMSGLEMKIVARGVDLSVLVHEAIKAVYMLPLQMSLEHLSEEEAEQVIMNTDTLFDEAEEFKYGPEMQAAFRDAITSHPDVEERFTGYQRAMSAAEAEESDSLWDELSGEEQRLYWMVFGMIAAMGKEDPKEMLKVVHAVLTGDKKQIEDLFYPIIEEALNNLASHEEYGRGYEEEDDTPRYETPAPEIREEPEMRPEAEMSKDEIANAIIDAYMRGDEEEADRLRKKYIGEGLNLSFKAWLRVNG